MPCSQQNSAPSPGAVSYATEADCLNACKEGACCEGTTCSVKPQCQCQGAGKVFKGVGTTCSPNPCGCCGNDESLLGKTGTTLTVNYSYTPTRRWCWKMSANDFCRAIFCPDGTQYGAGAWETKPCESPIAPLPGAWYDLSTSGTVNYSRIGTNQQCALALQASNDPGFGTQSYAEVSIDTLAPIDLPSSSTICVEERGRCSPVNAGGCGILVYFRLANGGGPTYAPLRLVSHKWPYLQSQTSYSASYVVWEFWNLVDQGSSIASACRVYVSYAVFDGSTPSTASVARCDRAFSLVAKYSISLTLNLA
jgi:hypothetical protein